MSARHFLVSPVVKPMYFGARVYRHLDDVSRTRQSIYQGADWYNFLTGQRYAGGQTIRSDAALDMMPLLCAADQLCRFVPLLLMRR